MSDESDTGTPRWFWITVALAAAAGLGLREWGLHHDALEMDEVYEIVHQSTSLWEIANKEDSFPPIGRWVMGGWMALFGEGAIRQLSALAGTLGIVAVGWLGRLAAGARVGAIAAWFTAISAAHICYSQSARPYSLYLLFGTLAIGAAWRLQTHNRPIDWLLFAAASWLTLATHYYAALLIVLLFLLLLAELPRRRLPRAILAAAGFCVACLPLAYCLRIDLDRPRHDYLVAGFDVEVWCYTYFTLVSGYSLGLPLQALREVPAAEGIRTLAPWAAAVAASLGVLCWSCVRRVERRQAAWLLALLAAPPLMAAAAWFAAPTGFTPRYLVWMLPPLLVAMAAGAARWRGRPLVSSAAVAFVGLSLLAVGNRRFDPAYRVDDFHQVRRIIEAEGPGLPVLSAPRYFAMGTQHYLSADRTVIPATIRPGEEEDWSESLPQLLEAVESAAVEPRNGGQGASHYWIVTQHFPDDDARLAIREQLCSMLGAEHIECVSWTIDVYRAPAERLRKVVADQLGDS